MSMFSFINKKLKVTPEYTIREEALLEEIGKRNRAVLDTVPDWVPEHIFKGSYFNYGVPDFLKPIINLPVGKERTYTDLISYYSRFFGKVNYLELGVSVGKNFFQLANYFSAAKLTGFDIENINPVLEKNFKSTEQHEWDIKPGSIRTEKATASGYTFNGNDITYLAGDIWDENCWARLQGNQFNIIFSDALHDPKALLFEYEMIRRYKLLDSQFMYVWDDLSHGLEVSFFEIAKDLKKTHHLSNKNIILGKINGWCGVHEQAHDVGIVSNIDLK